MSIVDEALKKLGRESSTEEGSLFSKKNSDIGFVAGPRKRRPISFLLAIALVGAGVVVYLLLPNAHEISQPVRKASSEIPVVAIAPLSAPAQKAAVASAVVPVLAVGQVKQLAPGIPAAVSSVVANVEQAVPAPVWYEAGWKAAREGKWTDAFAHWEDGVRGLPKDRMVIVSNSYASLDLFLPALSQHVKKFPAIGIRQHLGGQVLYRVIVFPYGGGTRQVLPKVQNLFSRAGLVNASRVQERLNGNSLPSGAKLAQVTTREERPVVSQKPPAESKPPVDQKPSTDQKQPVEPKPPVEKLETVNRIATDTVAGTKAGDWEARTATVRDFLKEENYPEVSKNAQTLAHDFPDRWEGWFWLGTAQLAQGQMEAAETALERASKLNPKVAQIWVQRAVVAQERGDHASAVTLLNAARELSPKSPQIYLNLGYSYDAQGLTAEADKNYLRFLSLTEGDSTYALQRKPIIQRLESRH
jgi:tetratricopeptide (TPR) repeat protein